MCIAIYKDAGKTISKETLQQCYKANPDGAGFMYAENKELILTKGFFTFDEFYKAYKPHANKKVVMHFRIKTHGEINKENCHPFHIHKGLGFVHNGVISGFGAGKMSDTHEFGEEILKPLVQKWGNLALFQPAIKNLVENRIGYSKLIFLDRHGNAEIFNEKKGVWDNGIWYSNSSYKKPEPVKLVPSPKQHDFDYYYGGRYTPPIYKTEKAKPKEILSVGDLVELNRAHYDEGVKKVYNKGEVFEVIAINSDYTADIMLDDGDTEIGFLYNVPFAKLDFWNIDSPTNNTTLYVPPYYEEKEL